MTDSQAGIGMTSLRARERLVQRLRENGIHDERVLAQIAGVPRHWFVDEALSIRAYEDTALPIGYGQTISQPFIVARMSEVLVAEGPLDRVLEVGTGSGYQTAILAGLFREVYSIERIRPLHDRAREILSRLSLHNVHLHHGDGLEGWSRAGGCSAMLLAAAVHHIPDRLRSQLTVGGRLVAPKITPQGQQLVLIQRLDENRYQETDLGPVVFVRSRKGLE